MNIVCAFHMLFPGSVRVNILMLCTLIRTTLAALPAGGAQIALVQTRNRIAIGIVRDPLSRGPLKLI